MPDRFSHGRSTLIPSSPLSYPYKVDRSHPDFRHGGDIVGVENHLDYFVELGVTCLWPTPIFENDINEGSYHGYSISNFFKLDPRFGTTEDFINFVEAAHKRGLKVIIDFIFNHCAGTHPWSLDPPTSDWFHFPNTYKQNVYSVDIAFHPYASISDLESLKDYSFTIEMPDLNQHNPILAKYLIQTSIWWVEAAHLNGIRMDTFPYCDEPMMRDWGLAIEAEFPGINYVGEAWAGSTPGCAWWQRGNPHNPIKPSLPTVMDFPLAGSIRHFFNDRSGLFRMYSHFGLDYLYPDVNNVVRFIENHDMNRFLETEPTNLTILKKAWLVLLTIPGIPHLFYGTEILMWGKKNPTDGIIRKDFPGGWKGDSKNAFMKEGRTQLQQEAFGFLSKLLHWRQRNEIIAKGKMIMFRPKDGFMIYERRLEEKNVIVIINSSDETILEPERIQEITRGKINWVDVITRKFVRFTGNLKLNRDEIYLLEPK
jgi:glycosidase